MERIHYEGMKLIHYESVTENRLPVTAVLSWLTSHKRFCHKLGNLEWAVNKVPTQHSQVRSLTVIYTDHGDQFILLVMIL